MRQEVETGKSDNTYIQILSGISSGDQINIVSYRMLSRDLNHGDKVKVDNKQFQRIARN